MISTRFSKLLTAMGLKWYVWVNWALCWFKVPREITLPKRRKTKIMPVTTVISNMGSTEYVKPVKVRTLSTSWEINHCIFIKKKRKENKFTSSYLRSSASACCTTLQKGFTKGVSRTLLQIERFIRSIKKPQLPGTALLNGPKELDWTSWDGSQDMAKEEELSRTQMSEYEVLHSLSLWSIYGQYPGWNLAVSSKINSFSVSLGKSSSSISNLKGASATGSSLGS